MKIADMHCDTISELYWKGKDNSFLKENKLQIDIGKLKKSNYCLQTFAIFIHLQRVKCPYKIALEMIERYHKELEANKKEIGEVVNYYQIEENMRQGKISSLLSIEEGGICEGKLEYLYNLYNKGVRMMTLTWNFENQLAFPNQTREGRFGRVEEKGLKEAGVLFIEEMERLGMVIDISHLSDGGFYDVAKYTKKPFVASHSNARSICPHVRNLSDEMIKIIGERGGVIGVNFYRGFVDKETSMEKTYTTVEVLISHIKHIIKVGGMDSVGIGTDFDGIDDKVQIKDSSYMGLLYDGLKKAGISESNVEKICYKNVLRVLKERLQ